MADGGRLLHPGSEMARAQQLRAVTLTTYADYIPEVETENPLPEPVVVVPDTNVVNLFGQKSG